MTKWRHLWKAGTLHFHVMGEYSKLDRMKTMGTRGKINAIWWNIKINLQKLVDVWGYELATNLQNFTQKRLNRSENIPKSFRGGASFLKHPVEWLGYRVVKKLWRHIKPFRIITGTWRTDRLTQFPYQCRASVLIYTKIELIKIIAGQFGLWFWRNSGDCDIQSLKLPD